MSERPPLDFVEADGTKRRVMWSATRGCYVATDGILADLRAQIDAAHSAMDSSRHYLRKVEKYERSYRPAARGKASAA